MKKLNYIVGAALLGLAAIINFSCIDGNDWDTDSSYSRLFSIGEDDISVSSTATTATVTFSTVSGAEYYIIEISESELTDDMSMGTGTVYGSDQSITSSPYVISDLTPDTEYYLRMKAMSTTTTESLWTYYNDESFTTKTEQIIDDYSYTYNSITITWEAGSSVTNVVIYDSDGDEVITYTLSSSEIAAGTVTIEGLDQLSTYELVLYNGTTKRGTVDFTTPAKVPDADYIAYLADGDSICTTLFDDAVAAGYESITVALPAGSTYYNANTVYLPDGLTVNFFGISGGDTPVLAINKLDISGTHESITFENLIITADSQDESGASSTSQYFINQSTECAVETISFSNCTITGFTNTPFRLQGSDTKVIDVLSFSNCLIYTPSTINYAVVHVDANSGSGVVNNMIFSSSTISGQSKSFIYSTKTSFDSLVISDCTFYNIIGSSRYFLDCNSTDYGPSVFTISNSILGSVASGSYGHRCSKDPTVTDSYYTTDVVFDKYDMTSWFIEYSKGAADLFEDPDNYDFTIKDSSFAGKTSAGDPRWYYSN